MNAALTAACCSAPLVVAAADAPPAHDPLLEAERREQADLERLRAVNSGELRLLQTPAADGELHTRTQLTLSADSLLHGWVDMRQCQNGLDAMQSSEIVYGYADMQALQVVSTRNIGAAAVAGRSVQLRDVRAAAEVCVAARVKILHAQGDGRWRIRSGPYHRRFLDGYFPMRLSLEVRYPAGALDWRGVTPPAQPGLTVVHTPGRLAIDTRFTGRLTLALEFAAAD